jgi:hypothetical protein
VIVIAVLESSVVVVVVVIVVVLAVVAAASNRAVRVHTVFKFLNDLAVFLAINYNIYIKKRK